MEMSDATSGSSDQIGLAEAIGQVRKELINAQAKGQKESLTFKMGEVKLEFVVELEREGGGEAGVKLWVVNVGAKGNVTSTKSHTVTVMMTPQTMSATGDWEDARVARDLAGRPPAPSEHQESKPAATD
jgi:hypothetical protein